MWTQIRISAPHIRLFKKYGFISPCPAVSGEASISWCFHIHGDVIVPVYSLSDLRAMELLDTRQDQGHTAPVIHCPEPNGEARWETRSG
jgi:hypothetical protein